ncbi:YceI family protein [Lysinibacillus sp. BW-2-10]|uniref:YceI family protein n=1 Tax=Lysinibacillus sp. BW-2-10 TaxID=2590030 RepID=UPI00117DFAC8|nr:YceI family protein [Lysinibacillus sp. BW-2-10]TSI06455.1 YceI family protein [Lysinibacillus sp. BW-2-10]
MVKYSIDFSHSSITFSVKHMMITNVKGVFDSYSAAIEADTLEDLTTAKIAIEIDVASISTKDQARDNHLVSADFFHADKYPKINFVATTISKINDQNYNIIGNLTIKDVMKPITFQATYNGHVQSPWGQDTYAFSASTRINRKEFRLLYNAVLESGGLLISENVDVTIDFQLYPI